MKIGVEELSVNFATFIRTYPTRWDNVRASRTNNLDLGVYKNFNVMEKMKIQFRFELYNAFNHRQYSLGLGTYQTFNSNALSTSYANVSAQNFLNPLQFSGGNRVIQYGLKFIF